MDKKALLQMLFALLMQMASEENLKKAADMILDLAENWAEGDPTTDADDNKFVLAVCARIRTAFDIPDND